MAGYFNFFPSTEYANTIVTNLISKVKFDQSVQKNLAVFYPYTIDQGERPDQIAARYYNDPELDWLIYLANDIMDPYYDWPLSQNQFYEFVKESMDLLLTLNPKLHFTGTTTHLMTRCCQFLVITLFLFYSRSILNLC